MRRPDPLDEKPLIRPVKSLFVLSDLEAGGAQRVVLTVLRHLSLRPCRPHLALARSAGPLLKEVPENIPVHVVGNGRVRSMLPGLYRLIWKLRPRTVISTLGHLNLALLATRRFMPSCTRLVVREANTPSFRLQHTRSPSLYRIAYRRLYPRADRVLCNADFVKEDLARHFSIPEKRILRIPNPVDVERIRVQLENGSTPYAQGGIQLVSVGRLTRQKGYDLLFPALKKARSQVPDLHLTLVGDGKHRDVLRDLAERLALGKAITFAGHQDNPYPFMAHAHLFVSSSRYEGSPNAVLESMACGTPVVAFDSPGGTAEIIRHGRNGWLVPAEDWKALGKMLAEVAGQRAWETMPPDDLLPEEYACSNVVNLYERLLEEDRGPVSGRS